MFPSRYVTFDLCWSPDPGCLSHLWPVVQGSPGQLVEQVVTCASPLTAPESSFLERLKAVEEELDTYYQVAPPPCPPLPLPALHLIHSLPQCLDKKADDDDVEVKGSGCLAFRTRSKLRLINVPLGQLEAELLAPDITADMYEQSIAQRKEDRHWSRWLQGLMAPDDEGQGSR